MYQEVFDNYDAFSLMIFSTTMMSNTRSKNFNSDAKRIISFIGKAYGFSDAFIGLCHDLILGELSEMALYGDRSAFYSNGKIEGTDDDLDKLFYIKSEIISKLQREENNNPSLYNDLLDLNHYHVYQPNILYSKIKTASVSGDIIVVRQMGILNAMGIGCEVDYKKAIVRLRQCAFWGDIPSMYLLSYVYKLSGDEEKSKKYNELASLSDKYLLYGYTVLPAEETKEYSQEAKEYFAFVSTILQDIVINLNKPRIDFAFLEVVFSNDLDYYKKMYYINKYNSSEWREITQPSINPNKKFGF